MSRHLFIVAAWGLAIGLVAWCFAIRSHERSTVASVIHARYDGGITKSGRVHFSESFTAAMKDKRQIGKWKRVRVKGTDQPVCYVLITDLLPMDAKADIDLSPGAIRILGQHLADRGKFEVIIEGVR